ncbi:MAG TPA: VOC family protein, partial [Chloroflexota bacterium]|nr:VOC family protein [Chloroflexota bacterium]
MLRPKSLDHIALKVTDMDKTLHFYHQLLGLELMRTYGPNTEGVRTAVGLVSLLLVIYMIRHDWHIKNKRIGWVIKLLFLGILLGLLLGWAAIGFVIGLAAGAVIGLMAGVHIGLVTGQALTAYRRRVGKSASPVGIVTRLAIGGVVGATTGAVIGLVVGSVMGGATNFGGSIAGGIVGAIIGAVIGRGVSDTHDRVISTESNSLEGGGIGMPTGAAIGAMVGT